MGKKRILIVDDEEDIRITIISMLGDENYEISEAEDGPTCLELLKLKDFDLIIVDVMMPVMSGWELVKKILKTKKHYKNKILFLSVLEISGERKKELIKLGVIDYINKPFEIKELKEKICSALK